MRRLLLTNDDGIDAPGLAALEKACVGLAEEIIVVAPRDPASQIGHRVTTHEPIGLTEHETDRRYAVHGTPADCVRVALKALLADRPPDFVVSGINYGGNLGRHDVYISGTVAAAREAAFHGIPAAAVSNFHRNDLPFSWDISAARARFALDTLLREEPLADGELWNINLPHVAPESPAPQVRHCELERAPLEVAYERESNDGGHHFLYTGNYQARGHDGISDVAVCFGGDIAVTRLSL
ncbi:MAG: 5'/3'-nucleotidase SurE [Verrucomicrobiae bacterium]|nr:5'/3'-nucleotidase SurE [Verrucomicrobiae bacterium]